MAEDVLPGDGLATRASAAPAEVAALYDDWAPNRYDADLAAWGYEAPARTAALVADLAIDGSVLDAGCGTGLVGDELHRRGIAQIVGGDFSPTSVESARSRGAYVDVVHLDLNAPLDFADEQFGAVVSVGVFSYLTDAEATIRELLRVVQSGGAVVFTQRTDLWVEREFDALLQRLLNDGTCAVSVSEPQPYLPLHPEFGDDIGIYYATLTRC